MIFQLIKGVIDFFYPFLINILCNGLKKNFVHKKTFIKHIKIFF